MACCRTRVQANRYRKLDDKGEAHLIALACSPAPDGHDYWTLNLLADRVVELGLVESLSHETVRLRLKCGNVLQPWRKQQWCIPKVGGEFVAAMEDVLDLYAEPYGTRTGRWSALMRLPLSCWPTPGRPSQFSRDNRGVRITEYRRAGTRNIFLTCEPLAGWRHVAITERRTMEDFAHQMRWLVDEAYPDAPVVRVVLDNLNTHRMASLYETFPAERSSAHRQAAGISPHAQARQLAEHGGDRVQRVDPGLSPGA